MFNTFLLFTRFVNFVVGFQRALFPEVSNYSIAPTWTKPIKISTNTTSRTNTAHKAQRYHAGRVARYTYNTLLELYYNL